jgi:oxygen-dependent protoporphyrinogen oxidase
VNVFSENGEMSGRADRIVVIGGGISGLACAWRLTRLGLPVLLVEQEARPGGVIRTARIDGVLFEAGPQSFLLTAPLFELLRELGMEEELLRADRRAPRYVFLGGKLNRVPMAPPGMFFTSLFSGATKWRLLTEPFRHSTPPEADESIAAFIRRKFGADLLDHLVAPMVSGIYAGDPELLSLRGAFPMLHEWEKQHGSVLRGMIKSLSNGKSKKRPPAAARGLVTLRDGNASLPARLAERLGSAVALGSRISAVRRGTPGGPPFEVQCETAGQQETIPAAAVVVAAPANVAATLLAPLVPVAAELARISYAPVAVVAGSYSTEHFQRPLDGFGFLVPRSERLRILGTVWNSSLFPGRAPEGQTSLTSFVGGMTDPSAGSLPDDALFQTVESELRRILGVFGAPRARFAQRWTQAIPQYNLGHAELVRDVRSALAAVPGLFLTGSYLEGPAVGACVAAANAAAEQAAGFLREVSR